MATTLHARPPSLSGLFCPDASRCLNGRSKAKPTPKLQHPLSSWNYYERRHMCTFVKNPNVPEFKLAQGHSVLHPGTHLNQVRKLKRKPFRRPQPRSAVSDTGREHQAGTCQDDSSTDRLAYEVRIETSRAAGSGLSQPEGGVMVALIGTDGRFDLKRVDTRSGDGQASGSFDSGGTVGTQFQGASIGAIESILLSPVNGTWRPARASVLVRQAGFERPIQLKTGVEDSGPDSQRDASKVALKQDYQLHEKEASSDKEESDLSRVLYTFVWNESLIGEGCDESAAELVSEAVHTGGAASQLLGRESKPVDLVALRASGLAEYEELKLFLLGCTAALVGVGTLGSKLAFGDDVSIGFALGGLAGLLYLLLLERTVDQIGDAGDSMQAAQIASEKKVSESSEGALDRILNKVAVIAKGPASRIVLVALLVLVGAKVIGGGELRSLEPRQILAGLVGFLVYKVAVILAAVRPADSKSQARD